MKIRRLEGGERFDAYMTAVYCFHMRVEDPEAERERYEADTKEDWGAFDDGGTLMARVLNHRFDLYLDGRTVPCGGIGGVATLPEYRDRGAIRGIFRELLPAAYAGGEVLSGLYPFKHEFYRKQGYETVTMGSEYSMEPGLLCRYRFEGEVRKWEPGDPAADFLRVYRAFAPGFSLAKERTEEDMLGVLKTDKPYVDRKFSYLLSEGGEPVAYVVFRDVRNDPAAILRVEECAWTGRDGFRGILGFLARFEADYGTVSLTLPKGIDLLRIVESPDAYRIRQAPSQNFMVRVVNAVKLMEHLRKPSGCDFTMKVTDGIVPQNNVTMRVLEDRVEVLGADAPADAELDVRPLGQLAVGCLGLDEAELRPDVGIRGKRDLLRLVFPEKKIFVSEHF